MTSPSSRVLFGDHSVLCTVKDLLTIRTHRKVLSEMLAVAKQNPGQLYGHVVYLGEMRAPVNMER